MRAPAVPALLLAGLLEGCGSDGVLDLLPASMDAAAEGADGGDGAADAAADAAFDAPCLNGACPCGLTDCGGVCVDLANDPTHCGVCAKACGSHFQYCHAGVCRCLPGFTLCSDGSCHDLSTDPRTCGSCAHGCLSGEKCESGVCGTGACGQGLTGCVIANDLTACVELAKGLPYCGDCTTVCGFDQVCAAGACQPYAPATPCATCPCPTECARTEGTPSICCPPFTGETQPICVHATACPG